MTAEDLTETARLRHLDGRLAEAEAGYRQALALRPDLALAQTNLGLLLVRLGQWDEAADLLRAALRQEADNPDAQNGLGLVLYHAGRVAEAENAFRATLRLQPGHAQAMANLAVALQARNRLPDAEACYRAAGQLGCDPAHLASNLSMLLLEQGRVDEAEAQGRAALRLRPDYPEAAVNLAMALLARLAGAATPSPAPGGRGFGGAGVSAGGAHTAPPTPPNPLPPGAGEGWHRVDGAAWRLVDGAAWRLYESRLALPTMAGDLPPGMVPRWTGAEPIAGRTLLLWAEQGFGDTLQFCRYAPLLAEAGARVVLAVQPALVRVLSSLGAAVMVVSRDGPVPPHDLWCPLMSLPLACGTIPAPARYLAAAPGPWSEALAPLRDNRLIGLVWAGSSRDSQPHAAAIDRRRSMPLAALSPLFDVPGQAFVSLQLGPPAAQAAWALPGRTLHDPTAVLADFADTAALIMALDLVISVDTSVAHLAAALGKPVWLLNRYDTCWRWGREGTDSVWYPSVRQFRQPAPGDWGSVSAAVAAALRA